MACVEGQGSGRGDDDGFVAALEFPLVQLAIAESDADAAVLSQIVRARGRDEALEVGGRSGRDPAHVRVWRR